MKEIGYKPQNIRDLCKLAGIINSDNMHLKYTEIEMLSLLEVYMREQEGRLEKAKRIYREQQAKIKDLSSPELWSFKAPNHIPPDYKKEYLRRLKNGLGKDGVQVKKEQEKGGISQ